MSQPQKGNILQRTIDLNYMNKKCSSSLRWSIVNGAVLLLFVYDLSSKCEGYTSVLHYVEVVVAGVAGANLVQHLLRLLLRPRLPLELTPRQHALLGISRQHLDSSVRTVTAESTFIERSVESSAEEEALSLSLSPRGWRPASSPHSPQSYSPHSPHSPQSYSPHSPHSPHSPATARPERDEFIADPAALAAYVRRHEARGRFLAAPAAAGGRPAPAPHYHLAALDAEGGPPEEGAGGGAGAGGGGGGAGSPPSPQLWRRLQLDPRKLTQFNLNLRLWIHVTILERLVREMRAADDALAAHGLDARLGQVGVERLRSLSVAGERVRALLPYLEPCADQAYLVRRYHELARGGCLSEYKWNGGGADWDESRPTDAELVLHLVATYLDGQLAAAGPPARAFTAAHVSDAPPPRGGAGGAAGPVLHRVARRPPHYAVVSGEAALEVGAGRNNLLHALLVLVAVLARRRPPALRRLHLGPAGLNLLWVIGR